MGSLRPGIRRSDSTDFTPKSQKPGIVRYIWCALRKGRKMGAGRQENVRLTRTFVALSKQINAKSIKASRENYIRGE